MSKRTLAAWIAAAILGLALAAGVTLAASQLSSQRIGLSGEPASAGEELVPHATSAPPTTTRTTPSRTTPRPPARPAPTRTVTVPVPTPAPAPAPSGDDGQIDD
ncbi:MAG: hypothetical protein ACXVFN_02945 [Solirubrobacteraceae bacterium]